MASVLVVDDDATIRDMLYDLFADEHLCRSAATAEQAIKLLDTESYTVVITDLLMPGLSGVELLGYVRQQQPDTPVIIVSGANDQMQAERLIEMGAFDYLLKPFRLESVELSVARAIEHHRHLTEQRQRQAAASD